jgi:hypothetical protein
MRLNGTLETQGAMARWIMKEEATKKPITYTLEG